VPGTIVQDGVAEDVSAEASADAAASTARVDCNQWTTCCPSGVVCEGLVQIIQRNLFNSPDFPPGLTDAGLSVCGCNFAMPCFAGLPCTPVQDFCALPRLGAALCPGGIPDPDLPTGLCVDPAALVNELYPPATP